MATIRLALAIMTYAALLCAIAGRILSYVRPALSAWPPPDDGRVLPLPVRVLERSFVVAQVLTLLLAFADWSALEVAGAVRIAGAVAFFAGGAWALWGVGVLGNDATMGASRDLEFNGPYRFSRNPQYSATIVVAWALAVMSASPLVGVAALGITIVMIALPFAEEPWLRQRLGDAYLRYCETTPRFVPRLPR